VQTLITTIISQEADAKSQGSIMGLNTSYQSIGMIIGPIFGGVIATAAIALPFLAGSLLVVGCLGLSLRILRSNIQAESAF
jgi:MFS transporter, DHA1 family, multidrug resistance protein